MDSVKNSAYKEIEVQFDNIIAECSSEIESWDNIDPSKIENSDSSLDGWDYCFSIAIGLVSPLISTNEELQDYLKEIHNAASEATGDYDFFQTLLGNLLHHKGDPIDQIDKKFIKRDKNNAYVMFHRLLWGHDIFSVSEDNPFYLMVKKQGLSGIIQALQHLLADTTSKQGLPIPGSSYLDFVDENGNLSNYLIEISQQLSIETTGCKRAAQEIYSHMLTVRASDIIGAGSNTILNNAYLKIRRITDNIRIQQFRLISYSVSFWIQAIIGAGRMGVPYCNVPVGIAMLRSFDSLYRSSLNRTRTLVKKGKHLKKKTDHLSVIAEDDFSDQSSYPDSAGYYEEDKRGYENSVSLMKMWEGDLHED